MEKSNIELINKYVRKKKKGVVEQSAVEISVKHHRNFHHVKDAFITLERAGVVSIRFGQWSFNEESEKQ